MKSKAILVYFLLLAALQTLQACAEPQLDNEDAIEFFKDFESARVDVFEWIRDEFRSGKQPSRVQRDLDAVNGDTWYKNYQIKECESSNKPSFCNGQHVKGAKVSDAPEISERFDELDKLGKVDSDDKLQEKPTHDDQRINDKNKKLEYLFPVSDRRSLPASNYNPSNVEARFSAAQFLAKQQNAIHEIELKHHHLDASNDDQTASKAENENQLRAGASSNSNSPIAFKLDTLSTETKRSSGQQQKHQESRYDDQLDQKKNDLFDSVDEKLSKSEQPGLTALRRVKRRDNQSVDKIDLEASHEGKDETSTDEILKILDDSNNLGSLIVEPAAMTANREMNNGKDLNCDETMPANNNHTTTTDARIKRDIARHHNRQRGTVGIKGKQKISDLISGELPNEIVKAVRNMVESNEKLKLHIKPHLSEPNYATLKDSSKLSSVKIDSMMSDLVGFINELVNDQIQMRSCIQLTPEMKDFYRKLMGREFDDEDSVDNQVDDADGDWGERYEKSVKRFLTPRPKQRRFTRKVRKTSEEIDEKCDKIRSLQSRSTRLALGDDEMKWLEKFFRTHIHICDELKAPKEKPKPAPTYLNATQDFVKLQSYKNIHIESSLNDF